MDMNNFRYLYNYHFAENRKMWDAYIVPLTHDQFTHDPGYSHGSVRNQVVHLMDVDEAWFSDLRGGEFVDPLDPADSDDRQILRARWDAVEQGMRDYLAGLSDEMLFEKPFHEGEDENLILWQVLLHVVNHGTDHRAQILRLLNDLGVDTAYQDFIFYVYGNP
jgi:uncharacterized damage-inducible protein DinB